MAICICGHTKEEHGDDLKCEECDCVFFDEEEDEEDEGEEPPF